MKQTLDFDTFSVPLIKGVEGVRDGSGILITSEAERHFYIRHKREDIDYRDKPENPSFLVERDAVYTISYRSTFRRNMKISILLVEYLENENILHSTTSKSLEYVPRSDVVSVSLFLRVQGAGVFRLNEVTLEKKSPEEKGAEPSRKELTGSVDLKSHTIDRVVQHKPQVPTNPTVGELKPTIPESQIPISEFPSNAGKQAVSNLFKELGDDFVPAVGQVIDFEVEHLSSLELLFSASSTEPDTTGILLFLFQFTGQNGDECIPVGEHALNPNVGNYVYLKTGSVVEAAETSIILNVPKYATRLKGKVQHWKTQIPAAVKFPPRITVFERKNSIALPNTKESISHFLDTVPNTQKLIILYTTAPYLGHDTLELRPNRLAKEYAKLGHAVIFFPFGKVPDGLEYPFKEFKSVVQFDRRLFHDFVTLASQRTGRENIFICSSFPDVNALTAISRLNSHGWITVYEIRDDMEEFNRVGYSKWYHTQLEATVGKLANKVVTVSPRLGAKIRSFGASPNKVKVIPNAVTQDMIVKAADCRTLEAMHKRNNHKKVGYIGHLTPAWFDWTLLINTAAKFPDISFEIIGHGAPTELSLPDNITVLGPRTHAEFIDLSREWKVGLIPFRPSPLTFSVDPNKIYEYLAVGIRTVTARMGSVEFCPSTYIYKANDEFAEQLSKAVYEDMTEDELSKITFYLENAHWNARAIQMLSFIAND